jgi:PAS domain S-box-containing protein
MAMTRPATERPGIRSIRFRAALVTLVLIATALVGVVAYAHWALVQILVRASEARAARVSGQLADTFGPPMPLRLVEMQRLADDARVRRALLEPSAAAETAAFERLQSLTASPLHGTLELWTAAGKRVMGRVYPDKGGTVPLSDAKPAGSGVMPFTVVGNTAVIELVVPVQDAGAAEPIGYLLSRRVAFSPNTPDMLNRLVGDDGRVLLGNQSGPVWSSFSAVVDAPLVDASTPGVRHYTGHDGERRIAAIAHLTGTPLAVMVEFPETRVAAPAWALLRQLTGVAALFILIAVGVTWRLSARITRPLDDLADALRDVSQGDFSKRVEVQTRGEVGRLGAAFNLMTAQIESGLKDLEAQAHELKEKDQRKAAMMNAALDCIFTTDGAGDLIDCNPAAERVFGYDHAGFMQRNIGELLTLPRYEQYAGLADYVGRAGSLAVGTRREWPGVRADGTTFPVEVSLVAVRTDGAGGFAWFMRDLTDQKAAEGALLRGVILEEENRRVQEASRLKSEFLANMSHELRTPLNAIIGFAELLHDGQVTPDMPEFRDFMHDILKSGQHLLQLINDVLDLSKVEAGRLEFHPEETSLDQLIAESIGILRPLASQKRVAITCEIDPAVNEVFVDRSRFKQVLYNYLSNAIKFTPDDGRISVRIAAEGEQHFRVDVTDTGIGIAAADLPRLFIEFNQLEAGAAKKHQGTGLGLALTRRLVEAQGGRVAVTSTPGAGSTFSATLPRRATHGTPLADPRSIPSKRIGAASVLVIEDDAADQQAIVQALNQAGFNVETANSRAQALSKLSAQRVDAVTLDLILPDASGADVLRDIRSSDRNADVPVVVITIVADGGVVAGFAVHDILSKPVNGADLLRALDRAGVSASASGAVLVVDDDPGSLRLMAASLQQLGYRSTGVARAIEGLRLCEHDTPLAVVLDLQMPEMDGFGFLEHFRRIPGCAHVPVMVWTVKDLTPADLQRLKASVQGVMSKGHGSGSVVEELRRFVAEPRAVTRGSAPDGRER